MNSAQTQTLKDCIYKSLFDLATKDGINASGKNEIYGCIFGRDSALTILKILKVHQKFPSPDLLPICKRALLKLCSLQGKETNIESGEKPGKFIHEFRKEKFEHLINSENGKPWFVYPDGLLRNYDSLDSTPLALIVMYKYWEITKDSEFLITILPCIEMGLNWIITYGDTDKDGLIDYALVPDRKHGGLMVQSWTDSHQSLRQPDGLFPKYPIAPIEVQGFAWLALKLWARFYKNYSPTFSKKLDNQADLMKQVFNDRFLFKDSNYYYGGQAIDGDNKLIKTITGNPLICLWASEKVGNSVKSIIDDNFIESIIQRAFQPDLFDPEGGIRTMSTLSPTFNPNRDSYHNGSFWPVLNGLIHEGLENFGFTGEAHTLKEASLKPIYYFNSPVELYIKDESGNLLEYLSPTGQVGCKVQAWSAACTLDWLT